MIILTIRTDNPEAEVGVFNDREQLAYERWQAHRELAETLNTKIVDVLQQANLRLHDIEAIACFKGPGSFTGLRIGLSVGNALAYSLSVPVVSATGDDWREQASDRLLRDENEKVAVPEYGSAPHITAPKK